MRIEPARVFELEARRLGWRVGVERWRGRLLVAAFDVWEPVECWGRRWRRRTRPAVVLELGRRAQIVRLGSSGEAWADLAPVWCGRDAPGVACALLLQVAQLARIERQAARSILLDYRGCVIGAALEVVAGVASEVEGAEESSLLRPRWGRRGWVWEASWEPAPARYLLERAGTLSPAGTALKMFWQGDKKSLDGGRWRR